MSEKKPVLRSASWFGTADKNGFMYRSWMKNQGIADHQFHGKPIIGICNTWSELTPCNAHFRQIAEHVKRGVIEAGGFPVEFICWLRCYARIGTRSRLCTVMTIG